MAIITRERAEARKRNEVHVFEGVNLQKTTTHSLKKTAVTLLKDNAISTGIVSAISGTTPAVIDAVYDVPTAKRVRRAMNSTFAPVIAEVSSSALAQEHSTDNAPEAAAAAAAPSFCVQCGHGPNPTSWKFCPRCGETLVAPDL
eukprot:6473592-Amphidinium_carterae.1